MWTQKALLRVVKQGMPPYNTKNELGDARLKKGDNSPKDKRNN